MAKIISKLGQIEQLNFLLTNRIPRRALTRFMGWFSRIENKTLTKLTMFVWQQFTDGLNLEESEKKQFNSLQECFIRRLKPNAREIDQAEDIIISPCDAVVGAFGKINELTAFQAKGYPYEISELIPDAKVREKYRNGNFITLRLQSTMYHRFHAPTVCRLKKINYVSGDTWNVNPIALKRIERLYCKNERAILDLDLDENTKGEPVHIALVPVAAILVASMKFHAIKETLDLKYQGENVINCDSHYEKGEEMGYFQHGSTILVFSTNNLKPIDTLKTGHSIKMGQPLMQQYK